MHKTLLVILAALAAMWGAAPAFGGGGGHGGVCRTEPTDADRGLVAVLDSCFAPNEIAISTGDTVRWTAQTSPGAHTVTFADGPDSGALDRDFALRFNEPGTYRYSCVYHPGMVGSVEVEGEPTAGAALETLDGDGDVAATFDLASTASTSGEPMVIQFHPFAAAVMLLLGFPVSAAATLRLLGIRRTEQAARVRRRSTVHREPIAEQ